MLRQKYNMNIKQLAKIITEDIRENNGLILEEAKCPGCGAKQEEPCPTPGCSFNLSKSPAANTSTKKAVKIASEFLWITAGGTWLIKAKDYEQAYRICIANRIKAGQTPEEAEKWFEHDDTLQPIEYNGTVTDSPYTGQLINPPI
jgi:hypothetical protein